MESQNFKVISNFEENCEYHFDGLIDPQIETADFSLKEKDNFKQNKLSSLKQIFSRENILKFGIMMGEAPIPIETCSGQAVISILDSTQIKKRINSFSEEKRKKIGWIHISTIQIIIKGTFMKGINSPIKLILEDSRIKNPVNAVIAEGSCNLIKGIVKFDVNLQISLSLKDKDLNRSIILNYVFDPEFMKQGNHPFSITYKINYAISNSSHSVEFKGRNRIHIDELFAPLVQLESPILSQNSKREMIIQHPNFRDTDNHKLRLEKQLSDINLQLQKLDKKI